MDKDKIKMISNFEQSAAALGEFAGMLATYHNQLCDSGFQRPEALILVKELQAILFAQAFQTKPPDPEEE